MKLEDRLRSHLSDRVLKRLLTKAHTSNRRSDIDAAEVVCRALVLEALNSRLKRFNSWIPFRIVQFWDRPRVPADVMACMSTWRSQDAFEYEIFDDSSARDFISCEFDRNHAAAYAYCHHPAMKADYFRLAYLWVRGGIYVDADEVCGVGDFRSLVSRCKSFGARPFCRDLTPPGRSLALWRLTDEDYLNPKMRFYFVNDVLASVPRHVIVGKALTRASRLIAAAKRRRERCPIHWTTGPDNLTLAIYDASLDALRDQAEFDFSVITNWHEFAKHNGNLDYQETSRNWRSCG